MPSIDERIKAELERDNMRLDEALTDNTGLNAMVWDAFRGGLRGWMWVVAITTGLLAVLLVYLLVQFAGSVTVAEQISWGVWSILTGVAVVGFELWCWMQINRVATRREIKQMELSLKQNLKS
jgi:Na+/melibiose symporter-like transporter